MFIKRCLSVVVTLVVMASFCCSAFAQVRVKGYTRKDGTYVAPHYRSGPDGNFYNNWSTKGNVNPYTGKPGTKVTPPRGYGTSAARTASATAASSPLVPRERAFVEPRERISVEPRERESVEPRGITLADRERELVERERRLTERELELAERASAESERKLAEERSVAEVSEASDSLYHSGASDFDEIGLSPAERERLRYLKLMAERRLKMAEARRHTWATLPVKNYTDEDRAKSQFSLAHQLYLLGKPEAAKQWLTRLIARYPATDTADQARFTLARF